MNLNIRLRLSAITIVTSVITIVDSARLFSVNLNIHLSAIRYHNSGLSSALLYTQSSSPPVAICYRNS